MNSLKMLRVQFSSPTYRSAQLVRLVKTDAKSVVATHAPTCSYTHRKIKRGPIYFKPSLRDENSTTDVLELRRQNGRALNSSFSATCIVLFGMSVACQWCSVLLSFQLTWWWPSGPKPVVQWRILRGLIYKSSSLTHSLLSLMQNKIIHNILLI
jgi:hypothetical protein